jgi:hypothetical protein
LTARALLKDAPVRFEVEISMQRRRLVAAIVVGLVALVRPVAPAGALAGTPALRTLPRAAFEDKVRGGWAGQMIGVSFGAPTEFHSNGKIIEGDLPAWTPNRIENAIDQDDLYVEMTFAAVMDRAGLDATPAQYGEAFRTSEYQLWHANAGARRMLDRGIVPPDSGDPRYNVHADDIDFQIEADFIGLMAPGLPQEARKYSERVGRVMNAGDGLYGGLFVTAMYSAAYFESDPRKVVQAGLAAMPAGSAYAQIIADVLRWSAANPDDWTKTWHLIEDKWDKDDPCPEGALAPFNIDAKLNGAYIALGLLYGGRDFGKTIEVATRAGQDSDCNPSNAAGILGVMLGYDAIPEVWTSGIPAIADRKFAFTDYSFNQIVASTITRAGLVVASAGGRLTAERLEVPVQAPKPPALEQWNAGVPDRIVPVADASWKWQGAWTAAALDKTPSRRADGVQSVTFTFDGVGVVLMGHLGQDGGRADVTLDGAPALLLDAYIPPRTHDAAIWHAFGLKPGRHTVTVTTRTDKAERSTGTRVEFTQAVVYRARPVRAAVSGE